MTIIKCDYCGKEFNQDANQISKRTNHFCSRLCYGFFRRKRTIVKCETCGISYEKLDWFINSTNKNYCSFKCRIDGQIKNNIIELKGDHAEIVVNSPKYGEVRILIDNEDIEKIDKYKWSVRLCKGVGFYGQTQERNNRNNRKSIKLHRYIMDTPEHLVVDHIYHNTLDNRKKNLRNCTQFENSQNRKVL